MRVCLILTLRFVVLGIFQIAHQTDFTTQTTFSVTNLNIP